MRDYSKRGPINTGCICVVTNASLQLSLIPTYLPHLKLKRKYQKVHCSICLEAKCSLPGDRRYYCNRDHLWKLGNGFPIISVHDLCY